MKILKISLILGIFGGLLACGKLPEGKKDTPAAEEIADTVAKVAKANAEDETAQDADGKGEDDLLAELIARLKNVVEKIKSDSRVKQEVKDKIVAAIEKHIRLLETDPEVQEKTLERLKKGRSGAVNCEQLEKLLSTDKVPERLREDLEKRYNDKCGK